MSVLERLGLGLLVLLCMAAAVLAVTWVISYAFAYALASYAGPEATEWFMWEIVFGGIGVLVQAYAMGWLWQRGSR